ncbi:MAG: class I SAM-dependent methyltransferase [Myxococcota bacterium]
MGFYARHVGPRVVSAACSLRLYHERRRAVVSRARGRILEIGMGSGHNLRFYDPDRIEVLWGLEPGETMRKLAEPKLRKLPFQVRWLDLPGEQVPLDDDSVDTVLSTFTLCTIPDVSKALDQMHRVLKPGGQLLFLEHGEDPDEGVRRWQRRIEPTWKKLAGGCHITRPIPRLIEGAGFKIRELHAEHIVDPRLLPRALRVGTFDYWGQAEIG